MIVSNTFLLILLNKITLIISDIYLTIALYWAVGNGSTALGQSNSPQNLGCWSES